MKVQDFLSAMFILILVFLLVANWQGANALLVSGSRAIIGLTKTLQGR